MSGRQEAKAMVGGLPVLGYVDQTTARVDLVNTNKLDEEALLRLLDSMHGDDRFDQRWLSIARTHFEQGYMALNRSIFRPQRVVFPDDPKPTDAA